MHSPRHQVTILGFDQALATAIVGIMDLFRMAGVTWARIHEQPPQPHFRVSLATETGAPCRCVAGVTLDADCRWADIPPSDLLIVPTIGGPIEECLARTRGLHPWLAQWHREGRDLASNCTGAFVLAESGLLDGREATTHWGYSDLFRERYPQVELRPQQLITADGQLFCAGGGMAWLDLGIFLVERYCGADVARTLAKAFVIDAGRQNQNAYGTIQARRYHQDDTILAVQNWLDTHYPLGIRMDELAARFHLTPRTFKRRFRAATGEAPLEYLQKLRVEQSRKLLEQPRIPLEQVTQQVGYEDVSSFSRLFRRVTGMTPGDYRARFRA